MQPEDWLMTSMGLALYGATEVVRYSVIAAGILLVLIGLAVVVAALMP